MTDNCSGRKFRKQGEPQENKNRVETEGQETGYVWADTHLPPYLPYPRFLLKMDITQTAKLLYALLLDRTTLSQKNGWQDESGRTYIIFPVTAIADALDKSPSTIKEALNELDRAGLLERRRQGFSTANRLYVKLPPVVQISGFMEAEKPYLISPGNRTTDSQKTGLMTAGKLASNNYNINKTIENQTKEVNGGRTVCGRYNNIFLSEEELSELEREYPGRLQRFIEEMSRYLAATGKSYHNYAAAIRIWADNDRKGNATQGIPDYDYKEGESL
ncbi:replication initiator protein A [Lachnospiraceae bacterium 29-91]